MIPRLNEIIFDTLANAPFSGAGTLDTKENGKIPVTQELIIQSILNFTQRITNLPVPIRKKVAIQGGVEGLSANEKPAIGDLVTLKVQMSKLKMIKDDEGHTRRYWVALVNQTTREVSYEEFVQNKDTVESTFKSQFKSYGTNTFKAYVFAGNGELATSFTKEFNVGGN